MPANRKAMLAAIQLMAAAAIAPTAWAADPTGAVRATATKWREEHRLIDMHMHIDPTIEHMGTAVRVMDAFGAQVADAAVNGDAAIGLDDEHGVEADAAERGLDDVPQRGGLPRRGQEAEVERGVQLVAQEIRTQPG